MGKYKFVKEMGYGTRCEIEADSFDKAKFIIDNEEHKWEVYGECMEDSWVEILDDNGNTVVEEKWTPKDYRED